MHGQVQRGRAHTLQPPARLPQPSSRLVSESQWNAIRLRYRYVCAWPNSCLVYQPYIYIYIICMYHMYLCVCVIILCICICMVYLQMHIDTHQYIKIHAHHVYTYTTPGAHVSKHMPSHAYTWILTHIQIQNTHTHMHFIHMYTRTHKDKKHRSVSTYPLFAYTRTHKHKKIGQLVHTLCSRSFLWASLSTREASFSTAWKETRKRSSEERIISKSCFYVCVCVHETIIAYGETVMY